MVNISLRVLSRPDALSIPTIARELGTDYDEKGRLAVDAT
jgi:prohibitin 2